MLINTFILFNVFIAVLLDKMVQPDGDGEEAEEEAPEDGATAGADQARATEGSKAVLSNIGTAA